MLLFVSGVVFLGLGLRFHVESVAAIGAVAIVGSVVLPRMQGPFELGPGGIKGDLRNEIFTEVLRKAADQGLGPDDALELAGAAAAEPSSASDATDTPPLAHRAVIAAGTGASRAVVSYVAERTIQAGVAFEEAVDAIVKRIAAEKNWGVARNVWVELSGGYVVVDFLLTTREGNIYVEPSATTTPRALKRRINAVTLALREQPVRAALIVVPDGYRSDSPIRDLGSIVEVIEVGRLEQKLRDLAPPGN